MFKTKNNLILVLSLFSILLFTKSGCTHQNKIDRQIANENIAPMSAQELLTIKSTAFTKNDKSWIDQLKKHTVYVGTGIEVQYIPNPKLSSDIAFILDPVIENEKYIIKIYFSESAKSDLGAASELARLLDHYLDKKFISPFSIFEVVYNGKRGHIPTLQVMAKMRKIALDPKIETKFPEEDFLERTPERLTYWESVNLDFEKVVRQYDKGIKIKTDERKIVMDALDKATDTEQFKSLVARNDRVGAASVLRAYLPWELMPPFEKLFWETHLKIMAYPLPLENRVLIYRGIDDDMIHVAEDFLGKAGQNLTKEAAIKEQRVFFLSTLMTKNQGSWNRRLRSLTAVYNKYLGVDAEGKSDFTQASRISTMFVRHSDDPRGSPYLSFTHKYAQAKTFGDNRSAAFFVDPRAIYFNYATNFPSEIEFLTPLTTFPEDLAAIFDKKIHGNIYDPEVFLKEKAEAQLIEKLGKVKGEEAWNKISLNSENYFRPTLRNQKGAIKAGLVQDGTFIGIFKKLFGQSTQEVSLVLKNSSDMSCIDLLQLFW